MIINQPTNKDFEILGTQCLYQAFDMIFKIKSNLDDYYEEEVIKEEVKEDRVWEYNRGELMTSLILLHQGVESLMKSAIAEQSALLLIENNKADWPTLPACKDKDFDEFQTISGEKLLKAYCAIEKSTSVSIEFISLFEEIRILRNKFVHSVPTIILQSDFIIEKILDSFTYFFGKDKWIEIMRKVYVDNPLMGYYDWDIEESLFMKRLDFAKDTIGLGRLNKHFSVNIKSRKYYCPKCNYGIYSDYAEYVDSKWAFLVPNAASSTKIRCLVCQSEYDVKRVDCQHDDCKGNVVADCDDHDELCLSCFQIYDNI